jgi:hypothetical protein
VPGQWTFSAGPGLPVFSGKNLPLAITYQITFEMRLADGNRIYFDGKGMIARSSTGKLFQRRSNSCGLGEDGKYHAITQSSVADRSETLVWSIGPHQPKIVSLTHIRIATPYPRSKPEPPSPALIATQKAISAETQTEQLGHKSISGFDAVGTRTTRHIPPGEEGNDSALTVVDERWHSQLLGTDLISIHDDPRRGRNAMEVTDISQAEPDPALFLPPADYVLYDPDAPAAADHSPTAH